ncbi:MAG: post-transcriptional regulator [Bacillus sp. (in: firmicutes)]
MGNEHVFEQYRSILLPALHSKREEFILLGYKDMKVEHLWEFLKKKKWKKEEDRMLYQLINDILTITIGEYMTYNTVEAFKASQREEIDMDAFRDLLT